MNTEIQIIPSAEDIRNKVYWVRGKQVMLDADLAFIYGYEVKNLNRQVKRNMARFPEDFMFQLTQTEYDNLRCQNVTAISNMSRTMPFVFTEQGIYMLATVLKGELAERQSIFIMRAFREMRHFVANNALMFEKINDIELKQLKYQKETDEKFGKIFSYMTDHEEDIQKIFFEGQIFDAFNIFTEIISHAKNEIVLVDGYIDITTLNILAKKNLGVDVRVYTHPNTKISTQDINNFNAQYPTLTVKKTIAFHDRFLIVDGVEGYHIGASLKDAGKKCFGINKIQDVGNIKEIIKKAQQTGT